MKSYATEISLSVILIAIAAALWNPFWMPMGAIYAVLICFAVALGIFATFVWRERGGDERDILIRQVASRIAYLCTSIILAIGIVFQTVVSHEVDIWLVAAFIVMVIAKVVGYAYGRGRY